MEWERWLEHLETLSKRELIETLKTTAKVAMRPGPLVKKQTRLGDFLFMRIDGTAVLEKRQEVG